MSTQKGFVVLLVIFVTALMLMLMSQKPDVPIGPAPDADIVLEPGGTTVRISGLQREVLILEFWATWCGPCKMEMPQLEKIYQKYKNKRLKVVGISVDAPTTQQNIPTVLKELGITYPYMIASKSPTITEKYECGALPTLYVIDKKGNIRRKEQGLNQRDGLSEIDSLVGKLVEE